MKDIAIYLGALAAVIGGTVLLAPRVSSLGPVVGVIALVLFILFCAAMVWDYATNRNEQAKFQRWFDQGWGWRITGKQEPARIGTEWTTTRVALLAGAVLVVIFVVRLAIDLV